MQLEQRFNSKPLGYYISQSVPMFLAWEQLYGSHLERLDYKIKLRLRTVLSKYVERVQIYYEGNCDYTPILAILSAAEECNFAYPPSFDWHSFAWSIAELDLNVIEDFLTVLGDQIRNDAELLRDDYPF